MFRKLSVASIQVCPIWIAFPVSRVGIEFIFHKASFCFQGVGAVSTIHLLLCDTGFFFSSFIRQFMGRTIIKRRFWELLCLGAGSLCTALGEL